MSEVPLICFPGQQRRASKIATTTEPSSARYVKHTVQVATGGFCDGVHQVLHISRGPKEPSLERGTASTEKTLLVKQQSWGTTPVSVFPWSFSLNRPEHTEVLVWPLADPMAPLDTAQLVQQCLRRRAGPWISWRQQPPVIRPVLGPLVAASPTRPWIRCRLHPSIPIRGTRL